MFRTNRWLLVFAVVAAASVSGCGGGRTVGQSILDYPRDRAMDLVDVLGFEFYSGQGVLAHVQMTKIAQLGAGTFDGDILRCDRRALGWIQEMRAEAGLPFYYFTIYDRAPHWGNTTLIERIEAMEHLGEVQYSLTDPDDRGFYQVGGRLAVCLGLGAHVDLFQTMDFFMGWLGLDIGRDDVRHQVQPDVERVTGPRYEPVGSRPISGGDSEEDGEGESAED